ncbi:CMRF35-like molecule 9 isoform X1 [Pygocentrus nattereri]|uniref:CMRF35-like molecule 9 isoform X2 n=1 Tax=Pygocentrus nattereri TaxID=42514 RepID=UPI001891E812|nr:CMRF35-like molecule 9 isoform X2 [Pygocentrus nattereri]XP_037399147.1 CMRF35-like molecule 9 isoform X1 [Pygocentrus nattereri]
MKILLVFTLYLISGPVSCFDVTGYLGGSVLIYCKAKQYGGNPKHFCKKPSAQCVYFSQMPNTWSHIDRLSLCDSSEDLIVIYRNLRLQDAGSYEFGEAGVWNQDVNLKVNENPCCLGPKSVSGYLGETVTISCSYPEEFKSHIKYLYKQDDQYFTSVMDTRETQQGRLSISDDRSSAVVSVRISDVREDDGGVYYCGVSDGGDSVMYYSLYTETQLRVTASMAPTSVPPDEDQFSRSSDTPSPTVIISVCVCVVLLLIGGSALIFYKMRHNKQQDSSPSSRIQLKDIKEVPPVDSNSEEIEHTSHVSASGIHVNVSSATNSSDPQIHSNAQPLKDQDPTYTTVSFQNNPASPFDTSVVFSQEESPTEYATITNHTRQEQH